MVNLFGGVYQNQTILLIGNTGFKGSWMAYWLSKMGAKVIGYSHKTLTSPCHFDLLGKEFYHEYIFGDINDYKVIEKVVKSNNIDLVFHLAAQSLVRYSYSNPLETFTTNVIGTANVIEASKQNSNIKGIVVVSSDKCYENFEDDRPYNELDRMGGYDPYSASKGCTELVANSYRSSFFNKKDFGTKHNFILASARAGNVIGGGDWSLDRLIPDVVKNASQQQSTEIRNPAATRPWQHVLEPISGYLLLGQNILQKNSSVSEGWNFGPANNETLSVKEVLGVATKIWTEISYHTPEQLNAPHEAKLLRLDISKATKELDWKPVWNTLTAIEKTIEWYKNFYTNKVLSTESDLITYVNQATEKNCNWTK